MKTIFVLSVLVSVAYALRILSVLPTVTRSHYATGRRIMMELLQRGHVVVCISPFEEDASLVNFTWVQVEVSTFFEAVPNLREDINENYNFFSYQRYVWNTMTTYAKYITRQPILKGFLETDNTTFDLIMAEEFFLPVFHAFARKYNAPMVTVTAYGVAQYINEYTGNPLELSYYTHEFSHTTVSRNVLERIQNFVYTVYDIIGRKLMLLYDQNKLAKEIFKGVDVPDLEELERDVALVLVNSHFTVTGVRPNLPNVVEVGGVHIEEVKPLEKEIKTVLDGATDGAILFSFGSILDLESHSEEFVNEILTALSKFKQRVIIKWNTKRRLTGEFENIYPFNWLPQNDILAHNNLVLFITHGGLLSIYEAVHHGVPVICIPFQASQPKNCRTVAEMGLGVYLTKDELTARKLARSIDVVLGDDAFKNTAAAVSIRFRDRPLRALDLAVYWIEYCAKHKGIDISNNRGKGFFDLFLNLHFLLIIWTLFLLVFLCVIVKLVKMCNRVK